MNREELWMENAIYNDKLEEEVDRISGIKHRYEYSSILTFLTVNTQFPLYIQ